jgi:hypothetical protein
MTFHGFLIMHACEGDRHREEKARKEWPSLKVHGETIECSMLKLHESELFS